MSEILSSQQDAAPSLDREGAIAIIRLNRPQHHNRIEPDDLTVLRELLTTVEADRQLRVLIFTATGKSFSSGYHLGNLEQESSAPPSSEPTPFAQTADQLENLRVPTICALNGSIYGGATDLALACDFRLGIYGMRLLMPAARLGLVYYGEGMRRYITRLGLNAAKKLFLTATAIESEELLRIGYLTERVIPAELMARAHELAATLAGNAPRSVQQMKRSLNAIARGDFDQDAMNLAHSVSVSSADAHEGVKAWREHRAPDFND